MYGVEGNQALIRQLLCQLLPTCLSLDLQDPRGVRLSLGCQASPNAGSLP